jgi:non-canonical purine NTP pyrophosphatase (RdgB/HAM1 family)
MTMIKMLLASNNRGKYEELVDTFKEYGIELIFDGNLELEEESLILEKNAETKALCGAKQRNMLTLGEDTGFFIPTLDYFPGVHANRWMEGTWHEKRMKILELMEGRTDRRAYLINNFALATPEGNIVARAKVQNDYTIGYEEHINTESPTFGYNPLLILQGHYIGDLTREQRNFLKHRGRFVRELVEQLRDEGKDSSYEFRD